MYLLDTNICIYAIKKKSPQILDKIAKNIKNGIFISSLTIAEMEFGISNSMYPERNRVSLLEFLTIFNILDFCEKDAIPYGMIKTHLKRSGDIIGPIDMLLAAQAISNNLIMVTNNTKEFKRVDSIKIQNWI
jgi:tRNA(fMet)-specific endonuclease VapC